MQTNELPFDFIASVEREIGVGDFLRSFDVRRYSSLILAILSGRPRRAWAIIDRCGYSSDLVPPVPTISLVSWVSRRTGLVNETSPFVGWKFQIKCGRGDCQLVPRECPDVT